MAKTSDYRKLSTQGHKGRILIIDNEPTLLKAYSKSLSGSGFEVVEASRASEGLERLTRDRFDLVLADIVMPGVEGLEVLEQIRSRFPDVPVVVMLSAPDNVAALRAAELGVVQYLIKPVAVEALKATALHALTTKQSRNSEPGRVPKGEVQVRATLSVSATEAKNQFGRILETALLGKRVFITRHDTPKAVLISVDDFEELSSSPRTKLNTLTHEFNRLLEEMQKPGTRSKLKAAFSASPKQLGTAAVLAAKKRA
jgi:antitoxin Phd